MIPSLSFASCVDRLGWVLVHSLWQFALLMLGALVLQRALHRCSAVTRYWVLLVMMCTIVVAPVATWCWLPVEPPAVVSPIVADPTEVATIQLATAGADQEARETPIVVPQAEVTILRPDVASPSVGRTAGDRWLGVGWLHNIYWFYVEPSGLAPLFLGPVQSGAALGDIVVGPLLEARGEVRGTAEELAAFSAEWDQPEPMKRGNGEIGWYYAESKSLEAKRDGDKLAFHLTGLRPGELRVISRFKAGGKPISHVYSRREPNEDDAVFEVKLTESRNDLLITSQRQPGAAGAGPVSPKEDPGTEVRRQQQDRDVEARRQAARAESEEQERHTQARREALRAEIAQAVKQGDDAAARRHWVDLVSLPDPPLGDCRQAIQQLQGSQDWRSLAAVYEWTAKAMQAIIVAPPERFTRPAPPAPPADRKRGPTVEVQTDLDGIWHQGKGTAEDWFDWIRRKQREMKGERFKVLSHLAVLYRDRLHQPEKAATVLRESLADVPFFTIPLEKLIADQWPAKKRETELSLQLGIHRPAATDLVGVLEQLGQLDAAVEMQGRVVLASYEWGGLPHQDIEKLWTLLKKRPSASPLPRIAWINLLSPDRPSIEFDLDSFSAPRPEYKLNQLSIAPRPGLDFDALELTADMEGRGGYVQVWCSTLRDGKHAELGSVKWHQDRRKGRESRTAKFSVPAGTGVIYFNRAWLPDTDPDGVIIHRISVKATFR